MNALRKNKRILISITVFLLGALTSLFMEATLARSLGSVVFGNFISTLNITLIIAIVSRFGLDNTIIKYRSIYLTKKEYEKDCALILFSSIAVLALSTSLALIIHFGLPLFCNSDICHLTSLFIWILPILSITNIFQSNLLIHKKTLLGVAPEKILFPLILVLSTLSLLATNDYHSISKENIVFLSLILSSIIPMIIVLHQATQIIDLNHKKDFSDLWKWTSNGWQLMKLMLFQMILNKGDLIIVGIILGGREAAYYASASILASLIVFLITPANKIISISFAEFYASNRLDKIQNSLTIITSVFFFLSLPIAIVFWIYGDLFLILWGEEFVSAKNLLLILIAGRLMTVFFGPVGLVLAMTGYDRIAAQTVAACAVIMLIINTIFISQYGTTGVAIVTSTLVSLRALILGFYVYKMHNIIPSPLAKIFISKNKI